jgi:hypothetical protein
MTKYGELVRQVGLGQIVAAVDDLPEQTEDATLNGIARVYLRDQPYNQYHGVLGTRVDSLPELWDWLRRDILKWKGPA